jgi:hypothetical protein
MKGSPLLDAISNPQKYKLGFLSVDKTNYFQPNNLICLIYIINVLLPSWSRSCKHFVAKLGTAGIILERYI